MRIHVLFFGLMLLVLSACGNNCATTPYAYGTTGYGTGYGTTGYGSPYGSTYGSAYNPYATTGTTYQNINGQCVPVNPYYTTPTTGYSYPYTAH